MRRSRKRLPTVADGCGRKRNFWRTQPHPQTPKVKREPSLRIREKEHQQKRKKKITMKPGINAKRKKVFYFRIRKPAKKHEKTGAFFFARAELRKSTGKGPKVGFLDGSATNYDATKNLCLSGLPGEATTHVQHFGPRLWRETVFNPWSKDPKGGDVKGRKNRKGRPPRNHRSQTVLCCGGGCVGRPSRKVHVPQLSGSLNPKWPARLGRRPEKSWMLVRNETSKISKLDKKVLGLGSWIRVVGKKSDIGLYTFFRIGAGRQELVQYICFGQSWQFLFMGRRTAW